MVRMGNERKQEWDEAQKIVVSEDLVAEAKRQLRFLTNVDKNRHLCDGQALKRAIYRYKHCWLPLLAKIEEAGVSEGPVVVPLDCEWIWHCHRLNPVRYKADSLKLFGKIIGTKNIVSSFLGASSEQTQAIWNNMYPNEPYKLDLNYVVEDDTRYLLHQESTEYDLVSAVKRQTPFFYQVLRPSMKDDLFLEEAVARYKGFLHLIKRNREIGISQFCVPTYDIDLIWHSHQLNPVSYYNDSMALFGKILPHDDTDSDRTKGQKLDVGFSETTKQWEDTFGSRYGKAGAMYRGSSPTPLDIKISPSDIATKKQVPLVEYQDLFHLPKTMFMEVMVEIVAVKDVPSEYKESMFVSLSKQPDKLFKTKRRMSILSESKEKQVATFQCEPSGDFLLELVSYSSSTAPGAKPDKILGTTLISLKEIFHPVSALSMEKWFKLAPSFGTVSLERPISVRIAFSFTAPLPAPYMLHILRTRQLSNCSLGNHHENNLTSLIDDAGNKMLHIQMRDSKKEVICSTRSGEDLVLAKVIEDGWSMMCSQWFLHHHRTAKDGSIFELKGCRKVLLFPGRKLEYETNNCKRNENESDFMTVIEFSMEDPHGKAIALLNLRCGLIQVKEEWLLLQGIILQFILSDIMMNNGFNVLSSDGKGERKRMILGEDCKCKCEEENCTACGGCGGCNNEAVDKSGACGGCGGGGCGGGGCGGVGGRCGGGGCSNENKIKNNVSGVCVSPSENMAKNNVSGVCGSPPDGHMAKNNVSGECGSPPDNAYMAKNNVLGECGSPPDGYMVKNNVSRECGSPPNGFGGCVSGDVCSGVSGHGGDYSNK